MPISKRLFTRIRDTVAALDRLIDAHPTYLPGGTRKADLEQARRQADPPLPEPVVKLYTTVRSFVSKWRVVSEANPNRLIEGHVLIQKLDALLGRTVPVFKDGTEQAGVFWPDTLSEKDQRFLEHCYVLDHLEYGNYVLFTLPQDGGPPDLFLYLFPGQIHPLTVSFDAYFDLLATTNGLYLWQAYVTDPESHTPDAVIPDDFHAHMKALFPHADLSPFREPPEPAASVYNAFVAKPDKVDYRRRFEKRVADLRADKRFKKIKFEPNYGVPVGVLRMAREALGRELPESLLRFYYQMNGVHLSWKYADTDPPLEGHVGLAPLEIVLGGPGGTKTPVWDERVNRTILWTDDLDPEDQQRLKPLYRIEPLEGAGYDVVIRIDPDEEEPALLLKDKLDLHPLTVTFEEYLDIQLDVLGFPYWQLFVTKPASFKRLNQAPDFHKRLRLVFPDADRSRFRTS